MAIMLGANILLAMAKDTSGLRLIVVGEMFIHLLIVPLFYNFGGRFRNTYPPPLVWNFDT
jgi:hypothetical protein